MSVRVQFTYDPDEPDGDDATGMSEAEYDRLTTDIMVLGGYDMEVEPVATTAPPHQTRPKRDG